MKKLSIIFSLAIVSALLFVSVSVADARSDITASRVDKPCWSNHECGKPKPTPAPVVIGGFSGGLVPGADLCKSDDLVVYGEWSECVKGFGPSGLMTRPLIKTLNGCRPTSMQYIMTVRSCEVSNLLGGYGYFYGTDWLK